MRRAISIAALVLVDAARSFCYSWNTTTICVQDLTGNPYPKATVSYQ